MKDIKQNINLIESSINNPNIDIIKSKIYEYFRIYSRSAY
jgi:hypothetical protein